MEMRTPRRGAFDGLSAVHSVDPILEGGVSDQSQPPNRAGAFRSFFSSVKESSKVAFRVLGLSAFIQLLERFSKFRKGIGKRYEEPVKIAIHHNRTTALLRTLIHIVPVGIAMWEVVLNSAIIFSYVRHEIALGDGLPFGALFSGLQINQVSYLWSMEFWGSFSADAIPLRRKLAMIALITVSFALASAVGPSSAVLLIPRLDFWPAGSTHIWVNATFDEIWPDR
ncbi:MAG: hypothetical protein LQ347_001155 [Umbilicaria vellea]|nr:MAG: hypothetical protein LQ347_001155 [Umbilicaria vellea]